MQELQRSRVQQLWQLGKSLYRSAAVASAVFSVYQNPWLAVALVKAVWAAAKLLLGAVL